MNRLALILVFLFLTLKANAIYVTNLFVFPDGNTNRNVSVSFESIGTPLVLSNGTTIVSYSFNCVATNGVLGSTFLVGGPNYKVTFGPNPSGTWTIGAPLGTNTYALASLAFNVNLITNGYLPGILYVTNYYNSTNVVISNSFYVTNITQITNVYNITNGSGGYATNAIANNNGRGTNIIFYGATNGASGLPLADTSITNGIVAAAGAAATNYVGQLATGIIPAPNIQIGGLNIPTTSMNQLWSSPVWFDTNVPTDMGNPFGGFAFNGTNWYASPSSGTQLNASGIGCKFLVYDTNGNVLIANTNQPSLNAVSRLGYNNCCAMTPYKGLYYQIINILTNAGNPPTYEQGAASNVLCVFSNNGYMLSMTDLHWAPNVLEEIVFLTNGYAAICLFDGSNNTPNDYSGANRVLIYNPTNWTYTGTNITIVNPPYGGGSGYSGMALSGLDSNTLYFDGRPPTGFPLLNNTNVFFTYSLNPQTGIMTTLINKFTTNFGQYYTGGDVKVLPIDPVSHTYNPHIIYWLGNGVGTLVSNVYGSNAMLIPNQIISYSVDTTNQPVALNATGISSIPFPVFNTNANLGHVAYIAPLTLDMPIGGSIFWDGGGSNFTNTGNLSAAIASNQTFNIFDRGGAGSLVFTPRTSTISATGNGGNTVNFSGTVNANLLQSAGGSALFINGSTTPPVSYGTAWWLWVSNSVPYSVSPAGTNAFALQGASPSFGTVTATSFSGSGNALTGTNQANSGNLQSGGTNGAAGMVPTFTGAGGTWTAQTPSGGVTLTQLNTVATNATNYTATTIANGFNTATIGITNSPASFTILTTANGQIYEPYAFQGGQFWRQFVLSNVWNLQDANAANAITVSNITDTVNFAGNINGASNLNLGGPITSAAGSNNLQALNVVGNLSAGSISYVQTNGPPVTNNIVTQSGTNMIVLDGTNLWQWANPFYYVALTASSVVRLSNWPSGTTIALQVQNSTGFATNTLNYYTNQSTSGSYGCGVQPNVSGQFVAMPNNDAGCILMDQFLILSGPTNSAWLGVQNPIIR